MVDKQKPGKVDQQIPAADTDIGDDPQLDTGPDNTNDGDGDGAASPSESDPDDDGTLFRPPKNILPFLILSNRYDIVKELGKGGMGVVLLAKDRNLDRQVAIKRILVPDPSSLPRFITEARSIAALNHFNIVQIHEIARDFEGPYLVLEYVGGGSLLDRLKKGALDIEDAIQITCQLCDALTLAHDKGIIHRDIKPANILLTENGHPKLTDFGLARDLESEWGQTSTGAGMGTPHYVPPEQWRDATSVDGRSDLWSLAVTCYQMITGSDPKVIRLDQLPSTLNPVIGTMLEEDPDNRYATAEEFKTELRNAMAASDGTSGLDLATGVCPACNTANKTSRKFCRGCRASLMEPCLSCESGHLIWEDICGECGTSQKERRNEIRTFLSTSLEESLSFAREYEYEKALVQLATVQEDQHAFTEDIRDQAAEQVTLITSQRDQQYQLKDRLVQLAQQHLGKYDYAGAVRELMNIPAPLRRLDNAHADALLIDAEMARTELSRLREEIQHPQARSQLLKTATRYRQLKPNDKNIIAFFENLNANAGRDRAQIETLVDQAQTAFDSHQDESVLKLLNNLPDGLHRPPRAGELQDLAQDRLARVQDIKLSIAIETNPSKKRRLVQQYLLLRPGDTHAHELLLQLDEETKGEGKQIKLIAAGLIAAGLLLALTVFLVHSSIKAERVAPEIAASEGSMGGDQEEQILPEDELETDLTESATQLELERLAADKAAADKAAADQTEEERMAAAKAKEAADISAALAKKDWSRVLELDPTNTAALKMKDAAEKKAAISAALAKKDWSRVLELDPTNTDALRMKAAASDISNLYKTAKILNWNDPKHVSSNTRIELESEKKRLLYWAASVTKGNLDSAVEIQTYFRDRFTMEILNEQPYKFFHFNKLAGVDFADQTRNFGDEKRWFEDIARFRALQIEIMQLDKKFIVIKGKTFKGTSKILVPVPKERREEAGLQSELEVINELRKKAGLPPLKEVPR